MTTPEQIKAIDAVIKAQDKLNEAVREALKLGVQFEMNMDIYLPAKKQR